MGDLYAIFDFAGVNNSSSKDRGESRLEKVSPRFCRQTQDYIYYLSQVGRQQTDSNKYQGLNNPTALTANKSHVSPVSENAWSENKHWSILVLQHFSEKYLIILSWKTEALVKANNLFKVTKYWDSNWTHFFLYIPINVFQSKKAPSTHLSHEEGPLAPTQTVKTSPLHCPFHGRILEKRFTSPQTLILWAVSGS